MLPKKVNYLGAFTEISQPDEIILHISLISLTLKDYVYTFLLCTLKDIFFNEKY